MSYNETINLLERKMEEVVRKGDVTPNELDCLYKASKTIYYLTTTQAMNSYKWDDASSRSRQVSMGWDGRIDYPHMGKSYHSVNDRIIQAMESMLDDNLSDYERRKIEDEIHRLREQK